MTSGLKYSFLLVAVKTTIKLHHDTNSTELSTPLTLGTSQKAAEPPAIKDVPVVIIASVVGGVLGVTILVFVFVLYIWYRRRYKSNCLEG